MKLIDGWRSAHRFASVRLAAIAAFLGAFFAANPAMLQQAIDLLPESVQPWAPMLAAMLIFGTAGTARIVTFGGAGDDVGA